MSYLAQAKLTEDNYIILRVKACAASLGVTDAHTWVMDNIWTISASPGWAEAYGVVFDNEEVTDPAAWAGAAGAQPDVITDAMILSAVSEIISREVT